MLPTRRLAKVALGVFALLAGCLVATPPAYADGSPCGPSVNAVACENQQTGAPWTEWDVNGAGDATIQGYATDISVNVGQRIDFKVNTNSASYAIDIYRLGWYQGNGARKITSVAPSVALPQTQPTCLSDPSTGLYDCGNWSVSASWNVPSNAVSGVYLAKLTRNDGSKGSSHIVFIVRNDASTSALFFQTSDTTWQAYNRYGGANFYPGGNGPDGGRAYKLSYNRPFGTRGDNSGRDFVFSNEYPMIRFLERNGYDVSYTTGLDSDRRGNLIKNHKVFLSVGHDEYWSGTQRANVEAARDAGVNLAFFSGNEAYWKTRWEPSTDGSNTANRTIVCYKETWANAKIDPSPEWTGTWRDPRFTPPSNGGRPENGLTGTAYISNSDDLAIQVSATEGRYRIWRNSPVASNASAGQSTQLADHTIGYESDEDLDNGFRPAGLVDLSTTTGSTPQVLRDFGNQTTAGTTTHHLTLYRAASGALVFSAGSIQWAWGIDDDHDGIQNPADPSMQQATVNLFADMGVSATTLMSGLAAASASTDTTPPTATITSPAANTTVTNGSQVTVKGTAADVGGQVAGVEVSVDGGATWHPATGTNSWSYTFIAAGMTTLTVQARATDDSVNLQKVPATAQYGLTITHSLFGDRTPANPATSDTSAVEVGVKFTPQVDGEVTGIRFYKGTGNVGTHTGSLWSSTGTRLATGTFTNESATGWQTLTFSQPVPVTANTVYVASYLAPSGHYAADAWTFSYRDWVATPLSATRSIGSNTNGLFRYGGGFPNQSWNDTNYFVDVTYLASQDAPPFVTSLTPTDQAVYVASAVHPAAVFSKALDPATIQFTVAGASSAAVAGSATYDSASNTVSFTPTASLTAGQTYTATVSASDTGGHPMDAARTWSFTIDPDPNANRLFAANATPSTLAATDSQAVALGVKFKPAVNGSIIGLRFYKGPGNTGLHTGTLWTLGGTNLARVTFTNETASGWQSAHFATPVNVTAGITYVLSYYAPNGHYSIDQNFFASPWSVVNLTAPAGSNGVYSYGGDNFPNNSWNSTNYWVDPVFLPGAGSGPPAAVSLFDLGDVPAVANWDDNSTVEVGVKITASVAGSVTSIRFYKGSGNTGTHTGTLWSTSGQALATGTFTNETASGWQTLTFDQPVPITAGTTFIASYRMPNGHYAVNRDAFANGYDQGPLHVSASGSAYHYGGGFPDSTSNTNFWVDVVFQPN